MIENLFTSFIMEDLLYTSQELQMAGLKPNKLGFLRCSTDGSTDLRGQHLSWSCCKLRSHSYPCWDSFGLLVEPSYILWLENPDMFVEHVKDSGLLFVWELSVKWIHLQISLRLFTGIESVTKGKKESAWQPSSSEENEKAPMKGKHLTEALLFHARLC